MCPPQPLPSGRRDTLTMEASTDGLDTSPLCRLSTRGTPGDPRATSDWRTRCVSHGDQFAALEARRYDRVRCRSWVYAIDRSVSDEARSQGQPFIAQGGQLCWQGMDALQAVGPVDRVGLPRELPKIWVEGVRLLHGSRDVAVWREGHATGEQNCAKHVNGCPADARTAGEGASDRGLPDAGWAADDVENAAGHGAWPHA